MKPLHTALLTLALGTTGLAFAQSNDMHSMDMGKQNSDHCMEMMSKGMNMKSMDMKEMHTKAMDMKGMDMQKCHEMMQMHGGSSNGTEAAQSQRGADRHSMMRNPSRAEVREEAIESIRNHHFNPDRDGG